jgi:hypothetical protein
MTMNPETGEGFDAVLVEESEYFDPQATDADYPGSVGLTMRKKTYWQGDVEFDVFETVGPKFGPKWPNGTMRTGGLGTDADVWGLSDEDPPPPGYAPWNNNGLQGGQGGTNSGTNIFVPVRKPSPGTEIIPKHEWTPCFEDDGSPTMGDYAQRGAMDITLLGAYGGDIKFPVMPEEFGADFTHEYWTPRVVGLGEIIMPGGQSMETISWDSFFPRYYDMDYVNVAPTELEDPKSLTARIIWTMRFKMNCMLLVGGGIWNDQVVITNFNYRHKAGEVDDIYYTISMKRYRAPVVTTSPASESVKDRWPKDPRRPGGGIEGPGPGVGSSDEGVTTPAEDPNQGEVKIETDPPPAVVPDPGVTARNGGADRPSLVTVESTVVLGQPAKGIRDPGGPSDAWSETFQDVVHRLAKEGPNTMETMLNMNKWVTDNGYDPRTTQLQPGWGVKYFKEHPVTSGKPNVLSPVGAEQTIGAIGETVEDVAKKTGTAAEAIAKAWEDLNNAIRPPDWLTKPLVDWPNLNYRPDPSTVVSGGVPVNTPVERPQGGIRR